MEIPGTHNPEVAGSSTVSATIKSPYFLWNAAIFLTIWRTWDRTCQRSGAHLAHRGFVFPFCPPLLWSVLYPLSINVAAWNYCVFVDLSVWFPPNLFNEDLNSRDPAPILSAGSLFLSQKATFIFWVFRTPTQIPAKKWPCRMLCMRLLRGLPYDFMSAG